MSYAPRPNGPVNAGQKLPERFCCNLGGEWKPISSFSKKQQKLVQDMLSRGVRINPEKTGMICRIHSGEPVKEIQCEGPCNEIRVLDDFSKNNRTNGVYICKKCQHWTNTQEPGYAPWGAPKNQLDPLEKMDEFEARLPTEPSEIFDFHNDDERPLAPVTGTDGLTTLNDDEMDGPSLRAGANKDSGRTIRAPQLDNESIASTSHTAGSVSSGATNMGQLGSDNVNLWFSQANVAQDQSKRHVSYNAWDPSGRQHARTKAPTVQSGGSSVAGNPSKTLQDPMRSNAVRPNTHGFGSAGERQNDRKQMTEKEHRDLQRTMPQRKMVIMHEDDDVEDSD